MTTSRWPDAVVAFALMEFSKTEMTGAVVSTATIGAAVAVAQIEPADGRHTFNVEHLQYTDTIKKRVNKPNANADSVHGQ